MRPNRVAALLCMLTACLPVVGQVDIDWVTVGNAGNAPDTVTDFITGTQMQHGSVAYEYRISTTEITYGQYGEFLNAVAASDPNGLWDPINATNDRTGFLRFGTDGNYTYQLRANYANKPVNHVSWNDAARFCNWLTNGQPTGPQDASTTESGVYVFSGTNTLTAINRDLNNGDQVFLPTEDEWHKAAYHHPAAQGGPSDSYWLYATQSNSAPTVATTTSSGSVSNPGLNVANYLSGATWGFEVGHLSSVGTAGSASFYGCADMNGNVEEWTETVIGTGRVYRGGTWSDDSLQLRSLFRNGWIRSSDFIDLGFRVASPVPPPPAPFDIDWVTVTNVNNVPDTEVMSDGTTGYGSVAYRYRVSQTEVTNAQYADFLNAVARTDPTGLYNPDMATDSRGGIIRTGVDGEFAYEVKPNMAGKPVNFVSAYDAARFCNWITNGQGFADTESGVYSFDGPTSIAAITRDLTNLDQVFLPTDDEWYKAAFHQPAADGGDADDYWQYATKNNASPTPATATPLGDVANPGPDIANYGQAAVWSGDVTVTTVGSAGNSTYYGAFDMNGNVWEWTETEDDADRILRGGSWLDSPNALRSRGRGRSAPTSENFAFGIRLASPALSPPCPGDIADDFGTLNGGDGMVSFGDFLALLGLIGPCPGGTPGCIGDIADDFGSLGSDGMVSFGDFLALLGLIGPCP